jgi:hypothetical protein
MPRHLEPQQLSPAMAQDQKRKQEVKGQHRHNAYIDGGSGTKLTPAQTLPWAQ